MVWGWKRGSPKPPKKIVGRGEIEVRLSRIRWKVCAGHLAQFCLPALADTDPARDIAAIGRLQVDLPQVGDRPVQAEIVAVQLYAGPGSRLKTKIFGHAGWHD